MATMSKHRERSRVSFHKEEQNKNWYFNKCGMYCYTVADIKKKRKEKQNG